MKVKGAKGIEGCLIYIHGANKYMFRVYDEKTFKDYDIYHSDLFITITDPEACLYEHDDGRLMLDHNPETLGLVK